MAESPRILFVDDDEFVRNALRRLLIGSRRKWEIEFAESGSQALNLLESSEFTVIVSDMRMPRMDGAELLTRVAELYPSMTRVILSGQSEQEAFERAAEYADFYLSKPCSLAKLEEAVQFSADSIRTTENA